MGQDLIETKNELERKLMAAMNGELSPEEFMRALLDEQVFVPVRDEKDYGIAGFQRSTKAMPLVVEEDDGRKTLILFTSPERARAFLAEVPGYGGGLLVEFSWIVERMEPGFAISVNPGEEFGMDIEPEHVTQMLELLSARSTKM